MKGVGKKGMTGEEIVNWLFWIVFILAALGIVYVLIRSFGS